MTQPITDDYGWLAGESYTASYLARPLVRVLEDLKPKKILDLGCGNGSITKFLTDAGWDVLGCDPDARGIEIACKRVPAARFQVCGVYDDPNMLGQDEFDVIVASEVVEHLFFPRKLISFAKSRLAPSGYLVLTTPYHGYLKNLAISLMNKWDDHHGALDDGGHIKFWSPRMLEQLLNEFDFEIIGLHGAGRVRYLWKSMIVVSKQKSDS